MSAPFGKVFVVVNRRAGKGARHPDEFATILSDAGLDFVLHVTERRHHAVELARDAIDQGYGYLVAVGGDGTIHEVVNGMMGPDGPRNPDAVLGVVSAGSGADFARTFGLPDGAAEGVEHLKGDGFVEIDVGRDVLTQIGTKRDYVAAITKVYRGNHLPSPVIKQFKAKRVEVTTKSPLRVEADGELLGSTPATFCVFENALKIKV